jgi:hypothetical protein
VELVDAETDGDVGGEEGGGLVGVVDVGLGFDVVGAGGGCTTVTDLVGAGLCDAVGVGLGVLAGLVGAGLG